MVQLCIFERAQQKNRALFENKLGHMVHIIILRLLNSRTEYP